MATKSVDDQVVKVPLPRYLEEVADRAAEKAARRVLQEHLRTCPMIGFRTRIYGFVTGLSLVGGMIGWLLGKFWK